MESVSPRLSAPAVPTLGISWPLIVAVLALFGVLLVMPASRSLSDPDTYWHIAAGRWILEHGAVPSGDPFSHSMPGAPWTTQEWLSQLVLATTYRLGGWAALAGLAALSFAITLAGVTRFLLRRLQPVHALLFTGLTAGMLMTHLLARPHVLAWPLLALWVGALVSASEARRGPPWWALPLMLLWANLHGSFTLGLLLAVALSCDAIAMQPMEARRVTAQRWFLFAVLAVITSMVTPNGWDGLTYTAKVMQQAFALSMIGEWRPPDFQRLPLVEVWLLLILGLAVTGRLRLPVVRTLILLGLVHLAFKHHRNTAILGLVSPFLLAAPLGRLWNDGSTSTGRDAVQLDRWFRAFATPARPMAVALTTAVAVMALVTIVPARRPQPDPIITPAAALRAARIAGVSGEVLNEYSYGGYLIFQDIKVFLDGRSDLYGDELLRRNVDALSLRDGKALTALLDDYRIGWTLLVPGTPAVALLDVLPGWQRVYADNIAVVHKRRPDTLQR